MPFCIVDVAVCFSIILAFAMVVERVKAFGKFIGTDVELHAHGFIPCVVGFHLLNLLLKGERIIRRRRRGFALRLGRRGSLSFLGRTTAKLAELLAILFACDARINVRLDENEPPPARCRKVLSALCCQAHTQ